MLNDGGTATSRNGGVIVRRQGKAGMYLEAPGGGGYSL